MIETPDRSAEVREGPPPLASAQGRGHRWPATLVAACSAALFLSLTRPLFIGRVFVEQFITFPRFVLSGQWMRNLAGG